MKKEKFIALLKDPDVEEALGNIMLKAINQALVREIEIESGKDNKGGPPVIKKEKWNLLDFIAKYIPYTEGAIRGAQADSNQARNASIGVVDALTRYMASMEPVMRDYGALKSKEVITLVDPADKQGQDAIQGP